MCILRFHALGYLQTYETLLKEHNSHPGSKPVRDDHYEVECLALPASDRNFNVACETGPVGHGSLPYPGCHAQPSFYAVAYDGNVP